MNTPKWIPKHSADVLELFSDARQLERDLRVLGKKFATNVNLSLPDYYEFGQLLSQSRSRFEHSEQLQRRLVQLAAISADQRIERSPYKVLQSRRATLCRQNLKRRHCQLIFVMQKMIRQLLGGSQLHNEDSIDGALVLCTVHNSSVHATLRNASGGQTDRSAALVCSNTFACLMLPPKKFDLHMILQTISKQRSELCCFALITCLLTTCAADLGDGRTGAGAGAAGAAGDDTSDTSSVEILKALTVHLAASPAAAHNPQSAGAVRPKSGVGAAAAAAGTRPSLLRSPSAPAGFQKPGFLGMDVENDPTIDFFDKLVAEAPAKSSANTTTASSRQTDDTAAAAAGTDGTELLDQLVANEENYVANILLKCLKLCPSAFDAKPDKAEIVRWVNRGTRALWTQVGSTLEHVVLWWSHAPLACRPVPCARHLRDWLLQLQLSDAPEPVLSTLRGLGETLTVYVAATMWDRQFRLALVASAMSLQHVHPTESEFYCAETKLAASGGTTTGRLWSELLHCLTAICNSCDRNGTIPSELPIVEQIPVLHRLDHSVHTMRLWAVAASKALCTDWNVSAFFRVAHGDINKCLEQLRQLRVPEMVPSDAAEVLVEVCVALRAKLVSEIKVNVAKLTQTYGECIEVLSSICRTISLATLSLCFPANAEWQTMEPQTGANDYVRYFFNELYLPIVRATQMPEILSLVLQIMCEAWLDHIYMKRIRFSRVGAQNLQCDFDGVAAWIADCSAVRPEQRDTLGQHEVLRMCEGVAKILLRKPDDVISMAQSEVRAVVKTLARPEQQQAHEVGGSGGAAQLPPEMFVPNQQRWLELRARNRGLLRCLVCSCLAATPAADATMQEE